MFSPFLAYLAYAIAALILLVGFGVAAYERIKEDRVTCLSLGIIFLGIAFLIFLMVALPL